MTTRLSRTVVVVWLAACGPVGGRSSGGAGGASGGAGGHATGGAGGGTGGAGGIDPSTGDCMGAGSRLVYVVDQNNTFSSFHPENNPPTFVDIGRLNCPAQGICSGPLGAQPATPFSMSVDRASVAWVLYCSGELFRVDTRNAACQGTPFQVNQNNFQVFGMGFSTNQPMMPAETLFISGGQYTQIDMGAAQFGTVSFPALGVSRVGMVAAGWPELTGTGDAQLWGFFPADFGSPRVAQINKASGNDVMMYSLPSISGMPNDWAFAFWGDAFWIFLKRATDPSTFVYKVQRQNGTMTTALANTGRAIVGAGVSTCAPVVGIEGP